MSNIEAFLQDRDPRTRTSRSWDQIVRSGPRIQAVRRSLLQDKYNVGLLTDENIDYDNDLAQSDDYEASQFDNFWGVRDGPNAKQTVSII